MQLVHDQVRHLPCFFCVPHSTNLEIPLQDVVELEVFVVSSERKHEILAHFQPSNLQLLCFATRITYIEEELENCEDGHITERRVVALEKVDAHINRVPVIILARELSSDEGKGEVSIDGDGRHLRGVEGGWEE